MTPTTPQDVLNTFSRLTGIRARVVTHDMEAQAIDFIKHGFDLADLEAVIVWTQNQIRIGKGGFSELSLQWRVIFGRRGAGDEWGAFQDRLAMSQKTVRLRPESKPVAVTRTVDASGTTFTVLDCRDVPDPEPVNEAAMQEQLAALKKRIGGMGA